MTSSNPSPPLVASRQQWLDGAKGIGIVLVVYGHSARALYATATAPAWVSIGDRLIYAFHMPLFFVVAGLFVWPSLRKGRGRFVTDKLTTIVWPYVLWSLIEGGLEIAFAGEVNSPIDWHDLAMIPIVPIEQFWFLYVMAFCLLLALVCFPSRIALAGAAVGGIMIAGRYGIGSMALRTLEFFAYLAVGILFAAPIRALADGAGRAAIVLVGATMLFALSNSLGTDGVILGFVVAMAGSIATLAIAALLDDGRLGSWFALPGRGSLAIYVMHTIFSAGIRIGIKQAGLTVPIPAILAVTVIGGIAGPLGIWLLAERWGLSMPVGLGRPLRSKSQTTSARRHTGFSTANDRPDL